MRKSSFCKAQIIEILAGADRAGESGEVFRRHWISQETFYHWRTKSGGMDVGNAKRSRSRENAKGRLLKRVAPVGPWTSGC